jgi:leucyl-tRNA synthetase
MSKRYHNVVNPDEVVERYGADTFRMYEMFLGPVEQDKPWDTKGIEGVHRFLKKLWRMFMHEERGLIVSQESPTDAEWKALYKMIRKIEEDTERFSFNTSVSQFMIGLNELYDLKCQKISILEQFLIVLSPYAPHMCEELWQATGHSGSILDQPWPAVEERYLVETSKAYPVAVNGRTRMEMTISLQATQAEVEAIVLADPSVQKWLEGKTPKKVVYVPNRMINIVV